MNIYEILQSVLLRMRHVLDESCRENQNTRFVSNKFCHLWDNVEKSCRTREARNDDTIWRTRVAYWISKATIANVHAHTHASQAPTHVYVIAHTQHLRTHARTQRQICNTYCFSVASVIRKRASILRYACIACLVVRRGSLDGRVYPP